MSKKKEQFSEDAENTKDFIEEETVDSEDILDNTQNILQRKKNLIIGISAIVVIVIAGIFYFISSHNAAEEEASLSLSRVMPFYQQNDYERALNGDASVTIRGVALMGLKTIADEYSSTDAGKVAALLAGNALISTQKPDEAEKYFDIAASSKGDDVKAGANAGMASCKEFAGKFDEAAKLYEKAAELSPLDAVKSRYQYYAALCYEKIGNKDKAESLYRSLISEFQFSEFSASAKKGLIRLGTIIE